MARWVTAHVVRLWFWSTTTNAGGQGAYQPRGYNFESGLAALLAYSSAPIVAAGWLRHHNCHVKRCWRPGHPHPDLGVVCRRHRPI